MIKFLDDFLNRITMYRLVLYYLIILLVVAALFGLFGILPYDPITIAHSLVIITVVCWLTNRLFAYVFRAVENVESVYITAFILALIISPAVSKDYAGIGFLVFASAWSMASKYIFAIGKKHLVNPAAFGVALSAIAINQSAIWWVGGNLPLLPFVFIGGILIVRKIQRFDLIMSFSAVALVTVVITSVSGNYVAPIAQTLFHSSFFFLAFVMLTEPLTTPPNQAMRILYAAIVGFLFAHQIHLGSAYSTPELALLFGNIFSYCVSPKGKYIMKLVSREEIGTGMYNFLFTPDKKIIFKPGQYLEWTLGHSPADSRGNRRYFTMASSPTENEVMLGVKFYEKPSSYKSKLLSMRIGDTLVASQLAGDFVLPKNKNEKLVFLAGGIGVTPFRSMLKYLSDRREKRSITTLYSCNTVHEIIYYEIFKQAADTLGVDTVFTLTDTSLVDSGWKGYRGYISIEMIMREVPDYRERTFYVSGPHSFVTSCQTILRDLGVQRRHIKTDFFPGYT